MAEMGQYCKAYYVKQLRAFPGWEPRLENLYPDTELVDGEEVRRPRTELLDDDVLYLQENYAVTDGVFLDENIVFAAASDQWKAFCHGPLGFEIPADETQVLPVDA